MGTPKLAAQRYTLIERLRIHRRAKALCRTFNEADHPRDDDGKWTSGASGNHEKDHPLAGYTVDGLSVLDEIPNQSSIESSLTDWTTLRGIREVSMSLFEHSGPPKFYSSAEEARTKKLAADIKSSGGIKPLIVVIEEKNLKADPYILEGGHRFDALKLLGKRSFPTLVVIDHAGQ